MGPLVTPSITTGSGLPRLQPGVLASKKEPLSLVGVAAKSTSTSHLCHYCICLIELQQIGDYPALGKAAPAVTAIAKLVTAGVACVNQ